MFYYNKIGQNITVKSMSVESVTPQVDCQIVVAEESGVCLYVVIGYLGVIGGEGNI